MSEQPASRRAAWLRYTGLRLLCFALPFGVVWALSANALLSASIAAVLGLCLSMILLRRQREAITSPLAEARSHRVADEDVEDAAVDGQNASAPPRTRP